MSKLHTKLALEVEVLSPLHIDSGRVLRLDYDLVAHDGRTYRVDEDTLLERSLLKAEEAGAEEVNRLLMGRPAAELLEEADFEDPQAGPFRYVLEGTPGKREGEVGEQVKDVYGRLYLPGSSLKGALRTILAWGIYEVEKRKPRLDRLGRSRSWAAQPLERDLFGHNPNTDWLRALQVGDSEPLPASDYLTLRTVRVYPTAGSGGPGLDVDVEAVRQGTVFRTRITVEDYGFASPQAAALGWRGKRRWIKQLPLLGKRHAQQRLLAETAYFKGHGGPPGALRFYDGLVKRLLDLPNNALLLQVGWGAGWESKTLGSDMLRQDDRQFEHLLATYRMTKERNRRPGDPFPRSRHLALVGGRPTLPMGWVEVRIEGLEKVEVMEAPTGQTGTAPGQRTGRLKWFSSQKGYGFIAPDDGGKDIFVHSSGLADPSATLREGQGLAFDMEQTEKGPRAINVRVLT